MNKYLYGNADPINHIDASGNISIGSQMAGLGGLAVLSTIAIPSFQTALSDATYVVIDIANNFAEQLWAMAEATSVPNIKNDNDAVAYEANRRQYKNRCDEKGRQADLSATNGDGIYRSIKTVLR